MSEKLDILEETQHIISPDDSMGPIFLRNVFVGIFLVLVIVFLKIVITTQIYF